jgi:hypothetical protein
MQMNPTEDHLRHLLSSIVNRYGGAIEFWTVACLSQGDLGDPRGFIDTQWEHLYGELQEFRRRLAELPHDPPPVVHEQVAKLMKLGNDLREVFETFLRYAALAPEEIEVAVLKLGFLWKELQLRVSLAAAMIPLPAPLPKITNEQQTYYQNILDHLFDQFTMAQR